MNLAASDLGEQYIDNNAWSFIQFPPWNITSAVTGACDVRVMYLFKPPTCLKTINFKVQTGNNEQPNFAFMDQYMFGTSKYKSLPDLQLKIVHFVCNN